MFKARKRCRLATAFGKTQEMAEGHWAINVQAFIGKAREEFSLFAFKSPVKVQDAAQAIGQERVQAPHVKVLGSL